MQKLNSEMKYVAHRENIQNLSAIMYFALVFIFCLRWYFLFFCCTLLGYKFNVVLFFPFGGFQELINEMENQLLKKS